MPTLTEADDIKPLVTETKGLRNIGIAVFLLMFVGLGIWMYMARIEGAVIASGSVSVSGKPKTVQHLDGGIVADILVDNGDHVEAGQVVLRLDDTILKSNLDIYKNRFREAMSRRDRLRAEQDKSNIHWDDTQFGTLGFEPKNEFRQGQRKIFDARKRTVAGQISQLAEKIEQFGNQTIGLEALIRSKNRQTEILQKELSGLRSLYKDGYASENRVLSVERQIQELAGQTAEHRSEIARVQNSITEIKLQISQIHKEFYQSVLEELREVELSIKDMEQQIIATQEQLARVEIKAPISGVIHELSIFTKGGVIEPGGGILQIVPENSLMDFEVNVEPQFIDQIYVGQDVSLLFSAFNARTTPNLDGMVKFVSLNTTIDENTGMAYYQVKVSIPDEQLARLNGQQLISGMPVEAFFTTESRSPLNYLIKPLTDNIKRAAREE